SHDIVVKQALGLDHRAGWIWRLAPQLRLHLVHQGREAVQVADVNGEAHTILQARALRLRNQPDIEENPANSSGNGLSPDRRAACRRQRRSRRPWRRDSTYRPP